MLKNFAHFFLVPEKCGEKALIYTPGAAKDLLDIDSIAGHFSHVRMERDLKGKLEEVRQTLRGFDLTVLVLEDFFMDAASTFDSLIKILYSHLRHDRVVVMFVMQGISHQKNFSLLLAHLNKMYVHSSPSNLNSVDRICQRFAASPHVRTCLKSELKGMVRAKSEWGTFDAILLDFDQQLAVMNAQSRPIGAPKRGVDKLNRVLDLTSAGMGDDDYYYLVPARKLSRKDQSAQTGRELIVRFFPKPKREEIGLILELLDRNGLTENIDFKSLNFSVDERDCSVLELLSSVSGHSKRSAPCVRSVIDALQKRGIRLPKVSPAAKNPPILDNWSAVAFSD